MWTSIAVISLHQPWALALFLRQTDGSLLKRFETRHWSHRLRQGQRLVIHATKTPRHWHQDFLPEEQQALLALAAPASLAFGALIGVVEAKTPWATSSPYIRQYLARCPHENDWGDFSPGRYAWDFGRRMRLPEPIPYRGQQGLWRIPAEDTATLQQLQTAWEEEAQ